MVLDKCFKREALKIRLMFLRVLPYLDPKYNQFMQWFLLIKRRKSAGCVNLFLQSSKGNIDSVTPDPSSLRFGVQYFCKLIDSYVFLPNDFDLVLLH